MANTKETMRTLEVNEWGGRAACLGAGGPRVPADKKEWKRESRCCRAKERTKASFQVPCTTFFMRQRGPEQCPFLAAEGANGTKPSSGWGGRGRETGCKGKRAQPPAAIDMPMSGCREGRPPKSTQRSNRLGPAR